MNDGKCFMMIEWQLFSSFHCMESYYIFLKAAFLMVTIAVDGIETA